MDIIGGIKGIFDSASTPITEGIKSKENQTIALTALEQVKGDVIVQIQKFANEAHSVDMQSDNKLSKTIRPIGLIWLMIIDSVFIAATIFSELEFNKLELIGATLATLNAMAFGFYYGGKGLQRLAETFVKIKK